jgi:ketosteroid isomerase-like protein
MPSDNIELIRRCYEMVNAIGRTGHEFVDPEQLVPDVWARLAPDFELHERPDLPDAKVHRGREESKAFWRKLQEVFAEVRWEVREFTEIGDVVLVEGTVVGLGRGSDVPFHAEEANVFWFRDGALVKLQGFPSREAALQAISPGSSGADR